MTGDIKTKIETLKLVLIDLCSAFISANGVNHEFAYVNANRLVDSSLVGFDPISASLTCADEGFIVTSLMTHGYPRGEYVARLVARRIRKALDQINQQGGTDFLVRLSQSDSSKALDLLIPLYGVGPKFVETYCFLAGLDRSTEFP